jgi:cell wall-associated NlpC family hydrolase
MTFRFIKNLKRKLTVSITSNDKGKDSSSKRAELVKYALKFKGNPYKWGGTSLTKGADCSGFVQSVFKKQGIKIPRTSRSQAKGGRTVPLNKIQPGDLIFYTKNTQINHVALYIGNKKIIHASNPKSGIKISKYDYRKPYKAVSYID